MDQISPLKQLEKFKRRIKVYVGFMNSEKALRMFSVEESYQIILSSCAYVKCFSMFKGKVKRE